MAPAQIAELSDEHEAAFLTMVEDFRKNDPETFQRHYARKSDWTPAEFKKFLKAARAEKQDWRPKAGKESLTRYVLLGLNGEILANGFLRFPLDEASEREGGNLEFNVPPAHRGKGHATLCLNALLFEAVAAGLARALVICREGDQRARRAIERNRGEFLDVTEGRARYWVRFR